MTAALIWYDTSHPVGPLLQKEPGCFRGHARLGNSHCNDMLQSFPMTLWRCLLLVYPRIDVRVPQSFVFSRRFVHELPPHEIEEAKDSFRCFPALVTNLTDNQAGVKYDISGSGRPIKSC